MGNHTDIPTPTISKKQVESLKATTLEDGTTILDYVMS